MTVGASYQATIEKAAQPSPSELWRKVRPSPLFGIVVLAFGGSAWWAWQSGNDFLNPNSAWPIRATVLTGWVLSLCLHEFAHAAVAFLGGDRTVAGKGYLTLDPTKYTDGIRSVLLPIVFLLLGGIGLPGGAVYIQTGLIRSPRWQSYMSLAGPGANLLFGAVCGLPFVIGVNTESHQVFWMALSYLCTLQFFAAILNLLPIPGLDGFGAMLPFMSRGAQMKAGEISRYSTFLLFMLMFRVPGFSNALWNAADSISSVLQVDRWLADMGRSMFSFR
jgi:Zn-dependent protease